jgi:AraC family transcriptional regulator
LPPAVAPAFGIERSLEQQVRVLLEQALTHWDDEIAQSCLTRARALAGRESATGAAFDALLLRGPFLDEYIESHLESRIRIRDLAALMRVSVGRVHRLFRRFFGATPMSYVTLRRVRRAQLLMQRPGENLNDIALACGFCDQAHLCRVFKRLVGTTPARWRRQRQRLLAPYAGAPTRPSAENSLSAHTDRRRQPGETTEELAQLATLDSANSQSWLPMFLEPPERSARRKFPKLGDKIPITSARKLLPLVARRKIRVVGFI